MTTTVRITHEGPNHHKVRIGILSISRHGRALGHGHSTVEAGFAELRPSETWTGYLYDGQQLLIEEGERLPPVEI